MATVHSRAGGGEWPFRFVIFLACFPLACTSSAPMGGGGDFAVGASRSTLTPVCPPNVNVGPGWKTVSDETGAYELRVPFSLKKAPRDKCVFLHGGEVWEDGDTKVSLAFGRWAEHSFQEEVGARCRIALEVENVFMIVGKNAVIAWYDSQSGAHEPVVHASINSMAIEALAGMALSLVYLETKSHTP